MKPWAGTVWIGETGDAGLAPQGRDLYLGGGTGPQGHRTPEYADGHQTSRVQQDNAPAES